MTTYSIYCSFHAICSDLSFDWTITFMYICILRNNLKPETRDKQQGYTSLLKEKDYKKCALRG